MTVWIKEGCEGALSIPMRKAHGKVAALYSSKGLPMYVTRRREFALKTLDGSLHFDGNAEDVFDPAKNVSLTEMRLCLGRGFDVVEYGWGYHYEYDPPRGV